MRILLSYENQNKPLSELPANIALLQEIIKNKFQGVLEGDFRLEYDAEGSIEDLNIDSELQELKEKIETNQLEKLVIVIRKMDDFDYTKILAGNISSEGSPKNLSEKFVPEQSVFNVEKKVSDFEKPDNGVQINEPDYDENQQFDIPSKRDFCSAFMNEFPIKSDQNQKIKIDQNNSEAKSKTEMENKKNEEVVKEENLENPNPNELQSKISIPNFTGVDSNYFPTTESAIISQIELPKIEKPDFEEFQKKLSEEMIEKNLSENINFISKISKKIEGIILEKLLDGENPKLQAMVEKYCDQNMEKFVMNLESQIFESIMQKEVKQDTEIEKKIEKETEKEIEIEKEIEVEKEKVNEVNSIRIDQASNTIKNKFRFSHNLKCSICDKYLNEFYFYRCDECENYFNCFKCEENALHEHDLIKTKKKLKSELEEEELKQKKILEEFFDFEKNFEINNKNPIKQKIEIPKEEIKNEEFDFFPKELDSKMPHPETIQNPILEPIINENNPNEVLKFSYFYEATTSQIFAGQEESINIMLNITNENDFPWKNVYLKYEETDLVVAHIEFLEPNEDTTLNIWIPSIAQPGKLAVFFYFIINDEKTLDEKIRVDLEIFDEKGSLELGNFNANQRNGAIEDLNNRQNLEGQLQNILEPEVETQKEQEISDRVYEKAYMLAEMFERPLDQCLEFLQGNNHGIQEDDEQLVDEFLTYIAFHS